MATRTVTALTATAAAAAMLALTPCAHAFSLLDMFSGSSDGEYTATESPDTTPNIVPNTSMAADYHATQSKPSTEDLLTMDGPAPIGTVDADDDEPSSPWPTEQYREISHSIARIINQHRVAAGEPSMRLDPLMSAAAQSWASEMARIHWFEHDPGQQKHGEIIALRYGIDSPDTAEKFVEQWENSPSHRALMHRKDFHAMGVGVAHDAPSGEVYAVVRLYYR